MPFDIRRPLAYLVPLGLAFVLTGCGQSPKTGGEGGDGKPKDPARTYIGRLEGGPDSARIGLVIQGTNLLGYVCSGEETFNRRNCRWFAGKFSADGSTEVAHDQGPKLAAVLKGNKAEGTVAMADGKTLKFQAAAVPDEGSAGVYRIVYPTGSTLGWIVDDTGFVGGIERKGQDGTTLGFWKSEPGVSVSRDEQRGMMALSYQQGVISATDIQRVASP